MQTTISCPSCQRELRLPDLLLGKLVKCPVCGTTFTASLEPPPVAKEEIQPTRSPSEPSPVEDRPEDFPPGDEEDYETVRPRRRRRRYLVPHRGGAILTLGILSIVICGLFGPFAWIMGNTDMAEIRAGRMDREGEGITQAGRICGIIGTVIGVLQLCYGGAICIAISAGGMK
jgi:hypothetical protein